jgi:hypothetical protein
MEQNSPLPVANSRVPSMGSTNTVTPLYELASIFFASWMILLRVCSTRASNSSGTTKSSTVYGLVVMLTSVSSSSPTISPNLLPARKYSTIKCCTIPSAMEKNVASCFSLAVPNDSLHLA